MKRYFIVPLFFAVVLSFSFLFAETSFLSEAYKTSPLKNGSKNSVIHELQNSYHEIYNMYKDSVVFISTEKTVKVSQHNPFMDDPIFREFFGYKKNNSPSTRKATGLGTGFIITADGYICTNHHVVKDVDSVTVTVADKTYKAKIVGSDSVTDIALLKIDGNGNFKHAFLGNSDNVRVGDLVVAIGNPFGLDKTFTSGVVSATARNHLDNMGNMHIQTDAAINQGNSGGPLINIDGEVIGVNRAIYSKTGGSIGIGFAIPVNVAHKTLMELKKYGKVKRGYMGVRIAPLTEEYAKQLGLKKNQKGLLVGSVMKGSPAAKGGIEEGDVILKVNGKMTETFQDLISIVGSKKIGTTLKVTVWRNKERRNFWITVKERP